MNVFIYMYVYVYIYFYICRTIVTGNNVSKLIGF